MINPVATQELRAVPLFAPLSDADLDVVAARSIKVHVREGTTLMKQGESGFKFFVVLDGTADVVAGGATVASVGSGEVVGEMAVLTGNARNADVVATSPMTLATMMVWDYREIGEQFPVVADALARIVAERRN